MAWLYGSAGEYLNGVAEFVRAGVARGEPVLVLVAAGRLPPEWSRPEAGVRYVDAADLGRNPARVMPAVRAFAEEHRGHRVRVLSELAWAGRSSPELGEVARYETMLNLAFATTAISMLCPYDAAGLPGSAISAACGSHPSIRQHGRDSDSRDFRGAADGHARVGPALRVPPDAMALTYMADLRPVRALVRSEATRAGLSGTRRTDLVIAASEVAANTLKHTGGAGLVRVWATTNEVLCQFDDSGHIADPLAGYGRPAGDVPGGQGLWLVNQVCDLAEIRTSDAGTTVRLHMYRDASPASLVDGARTGQDCVR